MILGLPIYRKPIAIKCLCRGALSRHYDERTYQNDLLVRDMFIQLVADTPMKDVAFCSKSVAIYARAFLFCKDFYSSSQFKESFSEYFPYVKSHGVMKYLFSLSQQGHYKLARKVFAILFDGKQIYKRIKNTCR